MSSTATAPKPNAARPFDEQRANAFAERTMMRVVDSGVTMMTSIGHRTGLFDAMADLPPSTSEQIAAAADLNERYVREWLGCMASAHIVDYDPSTKTYSLPAEHAAFLTRTASPNNIAQVAQFISVLGAVEDKIVDCFHDGGGIGYHCFCRFHDVMADESGQTVVAALEEHLLPLAPDMVEKMRAGCDVLDLGCGKGRAIMAMAEMFPKSRFTGWDFEKPAIDAANAEARERGLKNVTFEVRDAEKVSEKGAFDVIFTFDSVHDQKRPDVMLANIRRALRPGGVYFMQDIKASSHVEKNRDNPIAPFIYTISCMHCMTVSLSQGGMGLGAAWGRELAEQMLMDAGFDRPEVHELEHDPMNYFYIMRT
ncbi:MAG: class I SAM-dependent methyltransferase [Phycisphaerales bacterium]